MGQGAGEPGGSVVPGQWQTSSFCLCAGRAEAGWNSSQPGSLEKEETPPRRFCISAPGSPASLRCPLSLRLFCGCLVLAAGPEP